MGKKSNVSGLDRNGKADVEFICSRIRRLMQVSEGRWFARSIECSPALIYQWLRPNPRSLPVPNCIWKIASLEAELFNLDPETNFKDWLAACGYDNDDQMVKAHIKFLQMQGKTLIIQFPGSKISNKEVVDQE